MPKAYWRIIQDEIESEGWTVTTAVEVKSQAEILYLAKATRGDQTCLVEADSELGAMVELQKAVRALTPDA